MTDTEFLYLLDEKFEDIQNADIRGDDIIRSVFDLYTLCKKYLKMRVEKRKREDKNPLNGSD